MDDRERELIHKLLDGELSQDEREDLLKTIQADPALEREYHDLSIAVKAAEESGRVPLPASFAAGIMKRLPQRKEPFGARLRDFLFKGRTLRWNMAAALATLALAAVIVAQLVLVRFGTRPAGTVSLAPEEGPVSVTMNFYAPQAGRVAVAGSFNHWSADTTALTKQKNGIWTVTMPLKPGVYAYMFIVDGTSWVTDPNAGSYRDDGFGNKNAVLRVKT